MLGEEIVCVVYTLGDGARGMCNDTYIPDRNR